MTSTHMAQGKNAMKILNITTKGHCRNTLEEVHTYRIIKQGNRLNETFTGYTSSNFDILIK